jgi:DNA helicase-2/ATP-dependent DNA helicase PcrA
MGQFDGLNEEQRAVVDELDRNVLLIASAGTGKTNTLAYRIANILQQQRAREEEILCLTFTNKACREMKERVITCLQRPQLEVRIKTFHGFCYDIVKAAAKRNSDIFSDFIIFDEEDCKEIIKTLNFYKNRAGDLQLFIEEVKKMCAREHLLSDDRCADYQQAVERLFETKMDALRDICVDANYNTDEELLDELQIHGGDFVYRYDQKLQDMHGLDFCDLIVKAYELLQDKVIQAYWQQQFRFINVDEVQDTSELEYEVLTYIFGSSNLLFCGDYFQTIYAWRGSNPFKIVELFSEHYQPWFIAFDKNYRATRNLLNASYVCLRNMFPAKVDTVYANPIQAESDEAGEKIIVAGCYDDEDEAAWIYDTIQQLPVPRLSQICILTRSNNYNKNLSQYFHDFDKHRRGGRKLEFMLVDEYEFFRRQEIKDALAFIKLLINRHDVSSMVRILRRLAHGIGARTIEKILSDDYKRAGIRITDYLDPHTRYHGDPFFLLMQEMEKNNVVVFDVESTGIDPLHDEIIQLAAVRIDDQGRVTDKFMHFLKSTKSTGASSVIHHITDEYLQAHGEDPKQVLTDFLAFIQGAVVVGHNVSYDLTILKSQLYRLEMAEPEYLDYYDTLDIFRRFHPNLKNHKLEYLSTYFHIENRPTHDAFDDIMATADILQYAIEHDIIPTMAQRHQYMAAYMKVFRPIAAVIQGLRDKAPKLRPYELLGHIVNDTGLKEYYEKETAKETAKDDKPVTDRMENLREFFRIVKGRDDGASSPMDALIELQTYTSLSKSQIDVDLDKHPKIPIITVHQAKGMEFDYVFMAGMQEYDFPSYQTIKNGQLEEEMRVFYVAITRAKKQLFMTHCWQKNGRHRDMCRFINLIPAEFRNMQ